MMESSELLSVFGIFISILGVILSLLLFNASINNGRKVLINQILYYITYNILWMFGDNQKDTGIDKKAEEFNQNMLKLSRDLKNISYKLAANDIPIVSPNIEYQKDDIVKHTYIRSDVFNYLKTYFKNNHISNIELMLEYYDDRLVLCQHYFQKLEYVRIGFIGPIIGIKVSYKRNKKYVCYHKEKVKLIRTIKNIKDYREYYKNCYLKFDAINNKKDFERSIADIILFTTKENALPITIYR